MSETQFPYLHGFSQKEQERLRSQAKFGEFIIYQDVNFSWQKNILEVGCGVGAQTEILLRRFPDIKLTSIDASPAQLKVAKDHLAKIPIYNNRYELKQMDATNLEFEGNIFDGAFLCWILEHVTNPLQVLSEVRRVLRSGARIYITEVMNHSFFLEPYSPHVWKYWMAFNDFQYEKAGDPFIGAKLGNFLGSLGFQNITTRVKTWHYDNRLPERRREIMNYWTELLLSGADQLVSAGFTDQETVDLATKELGQVKKNPNSVFMYSFMQAEATAT